MEGRCNMSRVRRNETSRSYTCEAPGKGAAWLHALRAPHGPRANDLCSAALHRMRRGVSRTIRRSQVLRPMRRSGIKASSRLPGLPKAVLRLQKQDSVFAIMSETASSKRQLLRRTHVRGGGMAGTPMRHLRSGGDDLPRTPRVWASEPFEACCAVPRLPRHGVENCFAQKAVSREHQADLLVCDGAEARQGARPMTASGYEQPHVEITIERLGDCP